MEVATVRAAEGFVQGLSKNLEALKDPRGVGRCEHSLLDILAITILAVRCGADDWPKVEATGERRQSWLRKFLKVDHGIPSHDTFRRVLEALNRKQLAKCLFEWTQSLQKVSQAKDKVIAIDGKKLRASGKRKRGINNRLFAECWCVASAANVRK